MEDSRLAASFEMQSPDHSLRNAAVLGLSALALGTLASCRTLEKETPSPTALIDRPTFVLIDTDADGKVSTAEMAGYKHEEGLAEVDLDNDKRISPAEWKAARPSAPPEDGTFAKLDLNHDGFLAKEEAVGHITGQVVFQDAFKKMDANADGSLLWEEYAAGDAASLDVTLFSTGSPAPPTGSTQ